MATSPATDALPRPAFWADVTAAAWARPLTAALAPLASLRLTVILFALAIGIVMIGTLGQVEMDMWSVMAHYFYRWLAWVPVRLFFPPAWFPGLPPATMRVIFAATVAVLGTPLAAGIVAQLLAGRPLARPLTLATVALGLLTALTSAAGGGFYFPGGKAIGLAMVANLLAAHTIRFRIRARGKRLATGILVLAAGMFTTWLVIASGHNPAGVQGVPFFEEWTRLWQALKIAFIAGVAAAVAVTIYFASRGASRRLDFWMFVALLLPWIGLAAWLGWPGNDVYLGHAGMRILWQLIKAESAALVLLAGCLLLFHRRAGVVLLHGGVLLMMFGQVFVSHFDVEEQMTIAEGQTVNYAQDIRAVELAVIDRDLPGDDQHQRVVAIPLFRNGDESRFLAAQEIRHDALPFDIEIRQYFPNSNIVPVSPTQEPQLATRGKGLSLRAVPAKAATGADADGRVDQASAYLTFRDKQGGADLGTYLLSQAVLVDKQGGLVELDAQIPVADKTYEVQLRFRRQYKPYTVTLIDVRKDDYLGSSMVKNYSSDIYLIDPQRQVDRKPHIWMNNPLRYAGETFYQSRWFVDQAGVENTVFSVVTNRGWMIPYVACMIVATGLLAHFLVVLVRFLGRLPAPGPVAPTASAARPPAGRTGPAEDRPPVAGLSGSPMTWVLSLAVLLLAGAWVWRAAGPLPRPADQLQIAQFGRIPVIYRGRIKPLDTLARNSLRAVSNREEFTTADGRRQPAIRWLLDVITDADIAREHRVFRIDNLEVLNLLGLQRRPGSLYSIDEIAPQIASFEREVLAARQVARDAGPEKLSVYQKKLVELDGRLRTFTLLSEAFVPPVLPPLPTREEVQRDEEAARAKAEVFRKRYRQFLASIQARETPLAVPQPTSRQEPSQVQWLPYSQAWAISFIDASLLGLEPAEALQRLNTILVAYRQQDVPRFNAEVDGYLRFLQQHSPAEYAGAPVDFEARFNHFAPFYQCAVLYLFVFVLTALAWLTAPLGGQRPLNWAAFALVLLIFAVHTYAIVARIHISGRPPVTNLYGSAIFIGWGCVLLGLILEWIFRLGVGNMVAAVSGFATLLVAHFLADGDTLAVLQAVLDTQFWLATHVVTVTLGYATTYVAGLLGIFYILGSVVQRLGRPALQAQVGTATVGKLLATMIYGTLCFSIFFSFVGTVLGGLWADDSWGRFWGWDPKENGALIIVLWNALVLHARWGGMVKDRGLAMLAVAGNIAVSWSYFGVNELGIGLHSYGFTEGVLKWLGIFVASQLLLILLGWLAQLRWFGPRPAR